MEKKYEPAGCEHKLPNGLGAWIFHSEECGSGPDLYFDVHVCVCKLCGTIRVGGFRQDKEGKLNKFSEEISIHGSEAIDAIIKYANYIHEEEVWGRRQPCIVWVKASEIKHEAGVAYHAKDSQSKGAGCFDMNKDFTWGDGSVTHVNDQDDLFILDESATIAKVWIKGQYDKLYDQVKAGKRIACYVDYQWRFGHSVSICRDICTIKAPSMEFSSRGHGYGRVDDRAYNGSELERFIQMCEDLNVEWVNA